MNPPAADISPPFGRPLNWVLGTLVFLGAFLLFLVQPLISRFMLPWFGGAPAVWTSCMLFFQTVLCVGYFYGYRLQRRLSLQRQILIHTLLSGAALACLPIAPNPEWGSLAAVSPVLSILAVLAISIGFPFFVLSATGPLAQAWYADANPGRDPYRLYSLSNFGSVLGLLCYPFLVEPFLTLTDQSWVWSLLFLLYAALLMALLFLRRAVPCGAMSNNALVYGDSLNEGESGRVSSWRRVLWVLLPACGSLMLLAATNKVCQDIASVPFLWVLPLALYLLSFIVCFQHGRWVQRGFWAPAAAAAVLFLAAYEHFPRFDFFLGVAQELGLYFVSLFVVCMVCHGELARLKPGPGRLTEFYLAIAVGGAVGGVLVAVVAPWVFSSFVEWKIGLMASYLLALCALAAGAGKLRGGRLMKWGCGFAAAAGLFVMVSWSRENVEFLERVRNFHGVLTVLERETLDPHSDERIMTHGRVLHGRQFTAASKRAVPTSYYGPASGVARAFQLLGKKEGLRAGLVGLGVGTLAAYARPGDTFRFYEINPEVVRLAHEHFTYLEDCRGMCELVMGDARLSLEAEPPQGFDLLVLDAFSGDAIPAHLLTRESFGVYLRHLAPGGILAFHVTNKHLRLAPVVQRLADHHGLQAARVASGEDERRLLCPSEWMLLSRNREFSVGLEAPSIQESGDAKQVPLWTDHHNSLFQILTN